jgi:Family of unknown function (DUF6510)
VTEAWVDGNVLAGELREIFAVEMTAAVGRCAGCGWRGPIAETRVYQRAAGLVARCAGCEAVLLRLVRAPGRTFLDLHGLSLLEVAQPAPPGERA